MTQSIEKKITNLELQMLKLNPALMPLLKEGDLIDVTFTETGNKAVYFNVPKVGTGTIYGMELINAKNILKKIKIGDTVTAKVVEPENASGYIELSLADADKQKSWQVIKELKESGEPIQIKVVSANAGGLISEISGVQAFLPASQLSNDHYPKSTDGDRSTILAELEKLIGEELTVQIISVNPRMNKLIVSEREVVAENVKELIEKYKVGDTISGIVSGVASFGAFVRFTDHSEIEGLIHISELSHNIIDHPKEIVSVGDMIEAKIVEVRDGRISLSLKTLQENPWDTVADKFKEGSVVDGVVYKLSPFGAFVRLNESITGLIHVSEFGSVEELKNKLEIGKTYQFKINSIKIEEKRIILALAGGPSVRKDEVAEASSNKEEDNKETTHAEAKNEKADTAEEGVEGEEKS